MKIWSRSITAGRPFPKEHSKGGGDRSPEMSWSEVPPEARELALILEQTTTRLGERSFAHWIVFGIPADSSGLPADLGHEKTPAKAVPARQGKNGLGHIGYDGPYGSVGRKIGLRFRLFALEKHLDIAEDATREELLKGIEGHVLAEAVLDTEYERSGEGRR